MANLGRVHLAVFAQTVILNKGGVSAAISLDKHPIKSGKHLILPNTGW